MSESSAIICGEHGEWVINGTLMRLICLLKELDTTGSDQPLSSPLHYDPSVGSTPDTTGQNGCRRPITGVGTTN